MRYIDLTDQQYPMTRQELANKKNVSIPMSATDLSSINAAIVYDVAEPVGDVVVEGAPTFNVGNDRYERTYTTRSFTAQEQADADEVKASVERSWRDEELAAVAAQLEQYRNDVEFGTSPVITAPEAAALNNYRRLLCDYPQQGDFPNGTRPVAP